MKPTTIATLEQLENCDWFIRVGVHDTTAAKVLTSWAEAIEQCCSDQWMNIRIDAANSLRNRILQKSTERFVEWNDIVIQLKKTTEPFVRRKIMRAVKENDLPEAFEECIQWDIIHLCMEAEYADIVPPAFYAGEAFWYMKGHFPCGWDPVLPKGKPIIY